MAIFAAEGVQPETWSSGPGFIYREHAHAYHKILVCTSGSIVFHTLEGDVSLEPGQRLDLPAGTRHGARVGPEGVTCMEAHRVW